MNPRVHIRAIAMLVAALVALTLSAQSKNDIRSHIGKTGKVTIEAPDGLTNRSNTELNKPAAKPEKRREADEDDEQDHDKPRDKQRDENRPPQRAHTSSQTIQARSTGYRIQAFSSNQSNAKQALQQRARAIAMKFPQYRSYTSYHAPSWRLRIGDFKSQSDAQAALSRIRAAFPAFGREMVVVRDHINVWGSGH